MTDRALRPSRQAGFTLLEVLTVLALTSVILAIFVGFFPRAAAMVQGDADLRIVNWQLKLAREMAINQRRAIQLQFIPPNRLQIARVEFAGGTTVLGNSYLEHNTQFMLFPGQPDTPDGFGNPTPISFSGAASVMFTADGMLTDAAGNPVNGSVFLGQPGKEFSARALTIFGPTATIRLYRWNGTAWRR
jgi:prepilin-type N-terminal cleavage/methylation domain-containing protein